MKDTVPFGIAPKRSLYNFLSDYIYPEVLEDGTAVFEATALTHPLLSPEAVANNITLNQQTRLYLISGSNMAGKSTLMRSIGVNAVLANAGAPIRATAARISPFVLGASIALTDSLAEGRSKIPCGSRTPAKHPPSRS